MLSMSLISLLLLSLIDRSIAQYSYSEILPLNYNRDIAPKVDGQPVEVNVSMVILTLKPDKHVEMSFSVDFFYHLYWYDNRLNVTSDEVTLGPQWKDKLWIPDTYFRHSVNGGIPKLFHDNLYFRINRDHHVYLATRIQMKLNCYMNFMKFPFDRQICFINLTTLSQTSDTVQLEWEEFRLGKFVELPEYEIIDGEYDNCKKSFGKIGEYSCLYVMFHLKRNVGKYLIKRYIPSTLIVIMTFIGFWIPTSSTSRVSLIISALLAIIAQQIQGELTISYIYALEVYTMICIVFVFAALLELAVAVTMQNYHKDIRFGEKFTIKSTEHNNCVDILARKLFPTVFGSILIMYSAFYYFA